MFQNHFWGYMGGTYATGKAPHLEVDDSWCVTRCHPIWWHPLIPNTLFTNLSIIKSHFLTTSPLNSWWIWWNYHVWWLNQSNPIFSCKAPMFDVKIRRCSRWNSRFLGAQNLASIMEETSDCSDLSSYTSEKGTHYSRSVSWRAKWQTLDIVGSYLSHAILLISQWNTFFGT